MPEVPEKVTFSIESEGEEYDVEIYREALNAVVKSSGSDEEAVAGWVQDHLTELSELAHQKLASNKSDGTKIAITPEDVRRLARST